MCALWTEFPDDYAMCGRCTGRGTIRCSRCSGSGGSYEYDYDGYSEWRTCSTCSGSGDQTCPACWGTGSKRRYHDGFGSLDEGDDFDTDSVDSISEELDGFPPGTIECTECFGSGEVTCRYCHGTARELVPSVWGSSFQPCQWCRSTGVEECHECYGRGWVHPPCETCEGHGKTTCDLCDGTGRSGLSPSFGGLFTPNGVSESRWPEIFGGTGGRWGVICPRCDGSGTLECSTCNGLGVRYT